MTKMLAILVALLLTGCTNLSDEEIRELKAECRAKGGDPMVMAKLNGRIVAVRCL